MEKSRYILSHKFVIRYFIYNSPYRETSTTIGVHAKSIYNIEGVFSSEIESGEAETVTEDGITISVANVPGEAIRLIVVPLTKMEEAWNWIAKCLKETVTPIHAFAIYFEDQKGQRLNAEDVMITINCPHCTEVPMIYSLDTDGNIYMLNSNAKGRTVAVTFDTNGSDYYILAEKVITEEENREYDIEIKESVGGKVEISDKTPKHLPALYATSSLEVGHSSKLL